MIKPGDILIPDGDYCYCLRVDHVALDYKWSPISFPIYTSSTRYDLDEDTREPVMENPSKLHIRQFREVEPDVYVSDEGFGEREELVTFRRWDPPQGELF